MIVKPYKDFIPLRQGNAPDGHDGARLAWLQTQWRDLDDLYRPYNRQVEENLRFLAGQQWSVYHPVLGLWLDVTDWMTDEEKRWRVRPVVNRMLPWYILQHARATENPPIITFLPGPDRIDAELAEVMDIAFKTLWREMNMDDVNDRLMGWVLAAGRGHTLLRVDPLGGELRPWVGADMVPVVDEYDQPVPDGDGGQAQQFLDGVPFDRDGRPLMKIRQGGDGSLEPIQLGEPYAEPEGTLRCDVLSPLQVRGSWGPDPWHHKQRHFARVYLTPETVWERFGVEAQPEVKGTASDVTELERVLFGTGFYGAANLQLDSQTVQARTEGYVEVTLMWERPCLVEGMQKTEDSPGGRFLAVTRNHVLFDGPRPAAFPYTSPIHTWEFVRLPGRQNGTTPVELLVPIQRHINQNYARIGEHCNLVSNPKGVIDSMSGIKPGQFTNAPGDNFVVARRPGVPAIEYVPPPALGADVYKLQELLINDFQELGNMVVPSAELPRDASGELVKEMRFNDDRYLGPTMRRAVMEYGRFGETLRCLQAVVWTEEKLLQYAGEDNVHRTITVLPHVYEKGKVNVVPDVESMLPEGRGERQRNAYQLYMDGLLGGPPGTPEAMKNFWDIAHFPHMGRAAKPGGVHRVTAEQELGRLLQGEDPRAIPVYEWYDDMVHLMVLVNFMASPEFLKQPPEVQDAIVFHYRAHQVNAQMKAQAALAQQLQAQAQVNAVDAATAPGPAGKTGKSEPGSRPVTPPAPDAPRGGVPGGQMPTAIPA